MGAETVEQVRYLLNQGYKIGTEHVDQRRFRTGSWQSCQPIEARSMGEAIAALEGCLADHSGEYVRLFGIDPNGRRRVLETIIQRPDGAVKASASFKAPTSSNGSYNGNGASNGSYSNGASSNRLSPDTIDQVNQLLNQGYKIGTEHVDERRFRTGSWQSCSPIDTTNAREVVAALEECMDNHQGEYVRLIGIDPKAKRRVLESIIQRPNGSVPSSSSSKSSYTSSSGTSTATAPVTSTRLSSEVVEQLQQLIAGGYKISAEHVDQRRFRIGSWASCGQIQAKSAREAAAALEAYLNEYQGEYVRLVGIDPNAKRRVSEVIIQRP
ncbi:hypothetical protein NUACC21_03840 [Scytonema sp. NUACC21]